jgi:urease accessory protein
VTLDASTRAAVSPIAAPETIGARAPEFAQYQDEPPQMPSGTVGKSGYLKLGFERRGTKTILADLDRRVPYLAQRALYFDEALPEMPCIFMITTSGCVLQGDRLALEIALARGAEAHVTTQAATKIHAMDANYAAQTQSFLLDDDAYLEFLPDPVIPHRGARLLSHTRITIAPSATLLYSEILLCGRKHHRTDERYGFAVYSAAVAAARPDGSALFADKFVIEPQRSRVAANGAMGQYDVLANVFLLTPKANADRVHAEITTAIEPDRGIAYGGSRLPNDAGLLFKVVGHETPAVREKVREFWSLTRRAAKNAPVPAEFLWR